MKGRRHTTEDKNRILRAADGGKSIVEVSKEHNISEAAPTVPQVIFPLSPAC
jgi:transposase-like protein